MAAGVIYLDIDDEITSAAARIRSAEGGRVAVVLPYGSRVATSRINFRLLARDAMSHAKRLSIVAGDAATRALAASAGLPVFASVSEYEASIADTGPGHPEAVGLAASATVVTADELAAAGPAADADTVHQTAPVQRSPRPGPRAGGAAAAPRASPAPPTPAHPVTDRPAPSTRAASTGPEPVRRSRRMPILAGLLVLGLALIVGGVAAYLLLPTATVAITPRQETLGPLPFRVTASTTASEPDPEAGVVPAVSVPVRVEVADTFPATGTRVEQTAATGVVRFANLDPTAANTIARGAIVSTPSGIRFRTDEAVRVAAAELDGLTIVPSRATVKVTAVDAGTQANVGADTITVIPRGEEPLFLKVTNPDPTSGGSRTEFLRIRQSDLDGAVTALQERVIAAFNERLADPDLASDGATVFPQTTLIGEPVLDQDLDALLGQEVESFDLSMRLEGTVTAVDAAPVQVVAEARLASSVDPGYEMVDGSSQITIDPAVVSGGTVSFPVLVSARQVRVLDPAAIELEIRGLPIAEAVARLEQYGSVQLTVWPDWVGTIPTIDGRVAVSIDGPVTIETPPAEVVP